MKLNMNNKIFWGVSLLVCFGSMPILQSCQDDEAIKSVDLRYRVEDSYILEAKNPETISLVVKSTDKWEVFGKYDWNTITPASGDAGEKYTVEITCTENTDLDDRIDTISIKSDYWVGKRFTVTQKGIAYLNYENVDIIAQAGGEETFDVLSNQKWTACVTQGDNWLSIVKGESGELNGQITVKAVPNKGEQRTGIVSIFDRHGVLVHNVEIIEKGIILSPATPENGKWFAILHEAQPITIAVESNGEWNVSKENEAESDWYSFEKTNFTGNDNIVVNVSENKGGATREGIIVLSSKAEPGVTPVVKKIKFKQANLPKPQVHEMNKVVNGDEWGPGQLMDGGVYNFYIDSFADNLSLFFIWSASNPYAELRFHVIDNKTNLSTTPWCSNVFSENESCIHPVNPNEANVFSFDVKKYVDENGKAWVETSWILNGNTIGHAISDGVTDGTQNSDNWKVPYDQISGGANFLVRGKDVKFTKYEFVPHIDWGE